MKAQVVRLLVVLCLILTSRAIGMVMHSGMAHATPALTFDSGVAHADMSLRERMAFVKSISYHPDRMLKVTGRDIHTLLLEPELIRQDKPTIIWQYRNSRCVLDVFFKSQDGDAMKADVVHYEARARDKKLENMTLTPVQQQECVRFLINEKQRPRMVDVGHILKAPE